MSAPAPRTPTVSVVIPTRDRNDLLALCLERIAPHVQGVDPSSLEVIVTDDSASGAARTLLDARFPWVKWSAGPRRGPAANRNAGAANASGELLLFLDDDCLPEPTLVRAYLATQRDDVEVYEGRITCNAGITSPRQTSPINLTGGALWSCNFLIRRTAFDAVRGFDARYPLAHMEDVDLRDRLLAAGMRIEFVPEASVDHPPRRLGWGSRLARMHKAGVLHMTLHPPMRGLAWFLQNELRARVGRVRQLPLQRDSLSALASIPVELASIALHWRGWKQWARSEAARGR